MSLKLRRESALNLTLEGSIGSFSVGTGRDGQNSIEVKYLLTHVGLDFASSANEALLSHLAPVREIFDVEQLDFDEIMQRDIDDARVSSKLIPYLLDEQSIDLVKLFPPIVVVVLPVKEDENRPGSLYPKVLETEKPPQNEDETSTYILRSGSVGQEVFQFEQPIDDEGKRLKHDLVRFRLNTHKTRLVIVDGQHRAMALLALYRNLKDQWSNERRAPFKDYYLEWTSQYIKQFNLKEINLPVILCTFPSLDETYLGECDLRKAARAIFLTLNKNARPVSRTRNILLDDQEIIAYFLRRCLSNIKNKDERSSYSLRICNVELDQSDKEKLKIESPIAITGINHLYYIIEHLLLKTDYIIGIKPRKGNFAKRTILGDCMDRLNGRNLLGVEVSDSLKRYNFPISAANKLSQSFDEKYGIFIISIFENFSPYEIQNRAVLNLENWIEVDRDRRLRPILFGGQGVRRVFEEHRLNLKEKIKSGTFSQIPEIESIIQRVDSTSKRVENTLENFKRERAELYTKSVSDKNKFKENGKIIPEVIKWIDVFYDNVLKTVAFQSGLICGFFEELEQTNTRLYTNNQSALNTKEYFDEYIEQLNRFFIPNTSSQFKKLIRLFTGELYGEIKDWKITPTNQTFRSIVYRGEMKPDEWTKYRYLMLEIWNSKNKDLQETIEKNRQECRAEIIRTLYKYYINLYCRDNLKSEENLEKLEHEEILNKAFTDYSALIKTIGSNPLDREKMKNSAVSPSEFNSDDSDEDND